MTKGSLASLTFFCASFSVSQTTKLAKPFVVALSVLTLNLPVLASYQNPAYDRGLARMTHGDWDGAVESFGESIGFSSEDPHPYFMRGQCFYHMNNFAQAVEDFDHAIRISPDHVDAYLWRGNAHAKLGQEEEAITDYQRAIRLKPLLAKNYFSVPPEKRNAGMDPGIAVAGRRKFQAGQEVVERAGSYKQKSTNERAVELYKEAMEKLYPNGLNGGPKSDVAEVQGTEVTNVDTHSPPQIKDSKIALEETTGQERKRILKKAKQVDSSIDEVARAKAKKDIESYSEAIRQDKANPANYFHRGRMHQYLKNYDQAISDFSDAIRLSPQSSQFYLARASIYMLVNKPVLAKADVQSARSVDPTLPKKVTLDLESPQP